MQSLLSKDHDDVLANFLNWIFILGIFLMLKQNCSLIQFYFKKIIIYTHKQILKINENEFLAEQ
jgi:hypothetical protein